MILALAVAVAQSDVRVAPGDPTSQFKGDGGAIKFDPTCRDYTLSTVTTDAACSARIARAETAPSLAIAAQTLAKEPTRTADAIALLERAATGSNHPAAHYLLGSVLGQATSIRPDYAKAVRHLTIAADRGNPAAADLLASLLIAGKGAPRDVPRAIKLYERAAASGWPSAGVTLGKLYLSGKHVPRDVVRGRAWLDAAAAANASGAAQLAALAANDDKVSNFQLIPASAPAGVKAVRFGTFDNPDIPPSFGYDPAFQAVHDAPYDDNAIIARLKAEASTLPTPYTYEFARRLAPRDPERGMQTYLLARMRMAYDTSRCADPAALEAIRAWDMVVASDIGFLFRGARPSATVVDAALAEEARMAGDVEPWWVCRSGMTAMSAALDGKPGLLALKPKNEWPALREAARAQIKGLAGAR